MSTGYTNLNTTQNFAKGYGIPQHGAIISIKNAAGGYLSGCNR
jgi:hypothetical protein